MAQFVGGPYDGLDLPVGENLVEVRLPSLGEFKGYDPNATSHLEWPHIYKKARHGPVFRYAQSIGTLPIDSE